MHMRGVLPLLSAFSIVVISAKILMAAPMMAQPPTPPSGDPIVISADAVKVGGCTTFVTHTLSASEIRACETLSVTTQVASFCQACPGGIHLVLVRPGFYAGVYNSVGIGAIDELVRHRDETGADVGVAIVHYEQTGSRVELPITDDLDRARSVFASTPAHRGPGGYERAARTALDVLHSAATPGMPRCDFIMFFGIIKEGEERYEEHRRELLSAGAMMRRDDSTLLAHCPGTERRCGTMAEIPASPRYYSELRDVRKLPEAVRTLIGEYTASKAPAGLSSFGHDVALPNALRLVPRSAEPAVTTIVTDPLTTTLRWRWETPVDRVLHDISFKAEATEPDSIGERVVTGTLDVEPRSGPRHTVSIPSIPITLTGPCAPIVTPAATPTATDAPPTPTASPTYTPPSTATPVPQSLYLPLSLREEPCTRKQRVDVVLVMDASSSMNEPAGDGRTKLAAARSAAWAFIERMDLDKGDQAAIVTFNAEASIAIGLGSDPRALKSVLDSVTTASNTCLVCGIEVAGEELSGESHLAENQAVIILLTDGRSNPRPASEAVDEAASLKDRGFVIFTIGLGSELDDAALTAIASKPEFAHRASDGTALEAIYREIAITLPGPADCYWGRRR